MVHPVFRNPRSLIIYTGTWIAVIAVHFSVLYFFYGLPLKYSFADSAVFNLTFAMNGLILWFVVRYSPPRSGSLWNNVFNHISSAALILVVWLGISYLLLNLIFSGDERYLGFVRDSIPWRGIIGIMFYILTGLAYYLVTMYADLQERLKAEARLNELLKESELNALKSQINPHFLFNSLNSVSSLTITNPEKAQEMVIRLSDFLRYSVSANNNRFVSLEKELENIQRYLEIEKVRFGKKLEYVNKIEPQCQDIMVPALLLQPLFENAIKHGVYESTGTVCIETTCSSAPGVTVITMVNDFDPEAPRRTGTGVGLANIRERMKLLYHRADLLEARAEGNKFRVNLKIPINHE
jgi:two-component system, LytTR family, sensor kinase